VILVYRYIGVNKRSVHGLHCEFLVRF
jgi:hypothetical protein